MSEKIIQVPAKREQHEKIREAADLSGLTVGAFLRSVGLVKARKINEQFKNHTGEKNGTAE